MCLLVENRLVLLAKLLFLACSGCRNSLVHTFYTKQYVHTLVMSPHILVQAKCTNLHKFISGAKSASTLL